MKRITGLLLAVFLHSPFFQTALARDERTALVPLPSLGDLTRVRTAGVSDWVSVLNTNLPMNGRMN